MNCVDTYYISLLKFLLLVSDLNKNSFSYLANVLCTYQTHYTKKIKKSRVKCKTRFVKIGFVKNDPLYPDNLSPENKLLRFKPLLKNYSLMRDFMAEDGTSHLALDLRFGTISIREILRWLAIEKKNSCDTEPFFRQLIFREFYASLLYHFPRLEKENFRYNFKGKPNKEYFERFCNGETGVPIIDAGIKVNNGIAYTEGKRRGVFIKDANGN